MCGFALVKDVPEEVSLLASYISNRAIGSADAGELWLEGKLMLTNIPTSPTVPCQTKYPCTCSTHSPNFPHSMYGDCSISIPPRPMAVIQSPQALTPESSRCLLRNTLRLAIILLSQTELLGYQDQWARFAQNAGYLCMLKISCSSFHISTVGTCLPRPMKHFNEEIDTSCGVHELVPYVSFDVRLMESSIAREF
ncbi:hypothetical protein JB92DRAFT_2117542 [Gautieria morchelliformis]|nr:hypothetical protein JB92DRAFT_2117542 [Gautieria morchelliformis]